MPRKSYHGRVSHDARRRAATRLLPVAGVLTALTLLAACGEPPQPALTAPPEAPGTASVSASAYPPVGFPTTLPTAPVPTYPTAGLPTYPTATTTPPTTATTTTPPGPSPAAKCTSGPTAQQVLTVVKNRPGIPEGADLKVIDGPFCAGSWQFSVLEIAAADAEDEYEPLLVVSKGAPATLKVIEAGADVCSVKIQTETPPGIRVRACGA